MPSRPETTIMVMGVSGKPYTSQTTPKSAKPSVSGQKRPTRSLNRPAIGVSSMLGKA
jgi:hypothetical protein